MSDIALPWASGGPLRMFMMSALAAFMTQASEAATESVTNSFDYLGCFDSRSVGTCEYSAFQIAPVTLVPPGVQPVHTRRLIPPPPCCII